MHNNKNWAWFPITCQWYHFNQTHLEHAHIFRYQWLDSKICSHDNMSVDLVATEGRYQVGYNQQRKGKYNWIKFANVTKTHSPKLASFVVHQYFHQLKRVCRFQLKKAKWAYTRLIIIVNICLIIIVHIIVNINVKC